MTRFTLDPKPVRLLLLLGALLAPICASAAQLQPETAKAFEQQVAAAEQWSKDRLDGRAPFLGTNASADRRQRLQSGELVVSPRQGKGDIAVEKGIIHHWIGGVFVPGRSAADALDLLRDFDSYQRIYPASVEQSKTLERNGDVSRAYLRLRKHRIVTVVLNTEYEVEFVRVDDRRSYSRSVSTRIAQVQDPGSPREQELPVGDDGGFLWRIVTYWRFEEADGGVYLECEVLGLTRGVPYGLGWLIRPIIRSFPRDALAETLTDTRNALLGISRDVSPPRSLSRVNEPVAPPSPAPPRAIEAALP